METRRWLNQSQPQTLVNACILIYIHAFFEALGALAAPGIYLLFAAGLVAAGWGIANEKKWGYYLGVGLCALELFPYVFAVARGFNLFSAGPLGLIGLLFIVARLGLLLHPMSRDYQRIWFR